MSSGYQFTESAEKALVAAKNLAQENANSTVTPAHIASALLDADDSSKSTSSSLFSSILDKSGADASIFKRGVARIVVRIPAQDPPPEDGKSQKTPLSTKTESTLSTLIRKLALAVGFSSGSLRLFNAAQKLSKESGDTFIATVHLIVPLVSDSQIAPILKEAGGSESAVKQAVASVRAGKKVDSRGAEDSFEALSKYAIDLTALAEEGKLDPVIARDSEIRRCIRILSRRTKNNPVLIGEPGVGKTAVVEGKQHTRGIVDRIIG